MPGKRRAFRFSFSPDWPCFYFPIFEMNSQNRKRERFESTLANYNIIVSACFSWRFFVACAISCAIFQNDMTTSAFDAPFIIITQTVGIED